MGLELSWSDLTSVKVSIWSGVSSYGNEFSRSRCHLVSGPIECPSANSRFAYRDSSSEAISLVDFSTLDLVLFHSWVPSLVKEGALSMGATYAETLSRWSKGIYNLSPFEYSSIRYSCDSISTFLLSEGRVPVPRNLAIPCSTCTT